MLRWLALEFRLWIASILIHKALWYVRAARDGFRSGPEVGSYMYQLANLHEQMGKLLYRLTLAVVPELEDEAQNDGED